MSPESRVLVVLAMIISGLAGVAGVVLGCAGDGEAGAHANNIKRNTATPKNAKNVFATLLIIKYTPFLVVVDELHCSR